MKKFLILLITSIIGGLSMTLLEIGLGIEFKESVTSIDKMIYGIAYIVFGIAVGRAIEMKN